MSDDILHTGRADIHHPKGPLTGQAARSECAEGCAWASHMRGGQPLYVQICMLCKRINWEDLDEQVARVRATALHDFAASMRTLAEQAPEGEPAGWPWTAYALAAVKAEESAGCAGDFEARVRAAVAEEAVDLKTRLFDAEAALAELVRLKDGPRDAAYERDKPLAWSRARAVLAQIPAAPSVRPDTDRTPDVGTPEHPTPEEAAADALRKIDARLAALPYRTVGGLPEVEREYLFGAVNDTAKELFGDRWVAVMRARSVSSLPEETPDAR